MDLLGMTLQKYFDNFNKKIPLSTIKKIGIEILNILEYIHSKNIIHRDIKTGCFLIDNRYGFKIYIIDFGFAKEYIDPISGFHIPFKNGKIFIGDYNYSSKNSFLGYEKSRRDDIESLGYILIYLIKGYLPWENYTKSNKKQAKISATLDDLCQNLPINIRTFMSYCWNLGFTAKPDYEYLRNLIKDCREYNEIQLKSVYSKKSFDEESCVQTQKLNNSQDDNFEQISDKTFDTASIANSLVVNREDEDLIHKEYIKNKNSFHLNAILRTLGPDGLDEKNKQLYYALNRAINSKRTDMNYLVHRFVDNKYLQATFNFIPSYDIYYNLSMIRKQIGMIKIEKGFMSCYRKTSY
jgi:serine/threonine protein kinase